MIYDEDLKSRNWISSCLPKTEWSSICGCCESVTVCLVSSSVLGVFARKLARCLGLGALQFLVVLDSLPFLANTVISLLLLLIEEDIIYCV